jgi:nucleotide-binding universal stress UspA family protein
VDQAILVALDLGSEADRALPVADALAGRVGLPLDVVVVSSPGVDPLVDELEARWHAMSHDVAVAAVRLRYDEDVVDGIVSQAGLDRSLPCLATRARNPLAGAVVGSVGTNVVKRSHDPVLLVGPHAVTDPPPRFEDVVVFVDVSASAERAAGVAARWARRLGAQVHAVQVTGEATDAVDPDAEGWLSSRVATALEAEAIEPTWSLVEARRRLAGVLIRLDDLDGPLVVVGTEPGPSQMASASERVAWALVRRSPHPVLVVPPHRE